MLKPVRSMSLMNFTVPYTYAVVLGMDSISTVLSLKSSSFSSLWSTSFPEANDNISSPESDTSSASSPAEAKPSPETAVSSSG